ncbi:YveK family protein [Macrococcoides caseolyticum]|uniref:YveK family protein n=1 Tax=Macrococcoides caseolyticum TaxID=69966 RepID=UPI000C34AAA0|nr:Wzz/FepE/Etk N-terminal domain-containing protein [Macrococcus caseolyticus]PKD99977.1 capsule biosynthesis protein CapA [Macrococcus caseolyticus]PKE62160.1 capsule biosynthesis protein CapA [Macrococcus caseolyticus]PKF20062.1 capsule biosynthesis protein CapA [Macrococcus caseolyticus]
MKEVIDISIVLNLFKRNWKFIVGLSTITALIAALISFLFIEPAFQASTQILINNKEVNNQMEFQATQTDLQLINTYREIIKSPVILDKVADNLEINSELKSMIEVSNSDQSKVITINAIASNYQDAARIVNETAKVFSKEVTKIMNTDNVTVLNNADEKLKPSPVKPKPLVNTLLGFICGFMIALSTTLLKNIMDKRVNTEEDVQEILGLPVIGVIPNFDEKNLK